MIALMMLAWVDLISSVHASQYATVDIDQMPVREFPKKKANVVEKLKKGTVVAASNHPIEDFYKIRTPSGAIGWALGNDLILTGKDKPVRRRSEPSDSSGRKKDRSFSQPPQDEALEPDSE